LPKPLESPANGNCSDGVDNDSDGQTDCADLGCTSDPACVGPSPEVCVGGIDEDGDGLVDCVDPDCAGDPACPSSENCSDGVDNDSDGFVDCQDLDCANYGACTVYTNECVSWASPGNSCNSGQNCLGHCAEYDSNNNGQLNCVCP